MKKFVPLCFLLLVLPVAAAPAVAADAPATALVEKAAPLDFLGNASGSCAGEAVSETATVPASEFPAVSSCCRPQCSIDRDCDRICGTGLGQCRQVNSCCRQCLCLAV